MMEEPQYIKWLTIEHNVTFNNGVPLDCYRLDYEADENTLNNWALHLRRQYINDEELSADSASWNLSVEDFLKEFIIPQRGESFGPTARSNDISEILFADLLEFVMNYEVPRCKQYNRSGKNESEHGTDIIGYRFNRQDKSPNSNDELVAVEVKANLTANDPGLAIKSAVTDSIKDEHRIAHTLNYYRKKLKSMGKVVESQDIARFQQKTERDYKTTFIAAAMVSQQTIPDNILIGINGKDLELRINQKVFYVHGKKLMDLTHNIFERCVR